MRWLLHLLGVDDEPDTAWRPTGYAYRHTGHDEALGVAAAKRSDDLAEARRKFAARRAQPRRP
jgi:hypothetical protein